MTMNYLKLEKPADQGNVPPPANVIDLASKREAA